MMASHLSPGGRCGGWSCRHTPSVPPGELAEFPNLFQHCAAELCWTERREAKLRLAEHRPGNCYFNLDPSAFFLEHSPFFGEAFAGSDCVSWGNLLPHPWFEG